MYESLLSWIKSFVFNKINKIKSIRQYHHASSVTENLQCHDEFVFFLNIGGFQLQ